MTKYNNNHIIIQILFNNYTKIMQFTTTTEIAKKGSKIFQTNTESIVLVNNKPVWALLSYKIYEKLKSFWYIDEVIESINFDEKDYIVWIQNNLQEWNDEKHDNLFA